jgi:rubredoxin
VIRRFVAWLLGVPVLPVPLPVVLFCPVCRAQHVDTEEWAFRPHRRHRCLHCDHVWLPALVSTVGVEGL